MALAQFRVNITNFTYHYKKRCNLFIMGKGNPHAPKPRPPEPFLELYFHRSP